MTSEKDLIERLTSGRFALPPLRFDILAAATRGAADAGWDLFLKTSWQGQAARFAVECKAQVTPKAFDAALRRIKTTPPPAKSLPMLVMPYLRDTQLEELERSGLSGVDLCGNGVVIVPGRFSVYRSGNRNKFPSYAPIKNIYRRNTSMVARAVLVEGVFESVQAVRDAVNARNLLVVRWGTTPIGWGTVSKALKGLEEDLIIDRSRQTISLVQPDKLLDLLQENYEPPRAARRVRLKTDNGKPDLIQFVRRRADSANLPVVATGLASVTRYAVMQRDEVLSVYCTNSEALREQLGGRETDRFPNVELIETDDQPLYFDTREIDGFRWASPTQTYLELMTGDKRDRETAEQVRSFILNRQGTGAP